MGIYMAERIIKGVYTYDYVIEKRPDLKDEIDAHLVEKGYEHLITKQEDIVEDTPTNIPETNY